MVSKGINMAGLPTYVNKNITGDNQTRVVFAVTSPDVLGILFTRTNKNTTLLFYLFSLVDRVANRSIN